MIARENKIEEQNELFVAASGALSQLLYKYEIESYFRTSSCAGFQMLSMQDYPGQGEALVGWLDPFYDSKGITAPEKFRCYMDTTVALLRMSKFVWENSENFTARIQLAHYGTQPLNDGLYWKIRDGQYNLVAAGEIAPKTFSVGSSEIAGEINCPLGGVTRAVKLTVEVGLQNNIAKNSWNIWVYPASSQPVQGDVYVTDKLDDTCLRNLEKGGKILLSAHALGTDKTADKISFYPPFWSISWSAQGKNTTGMLVQDKHPLFRDFPTDFHSDWQWESIYKAIRGARAFYINDFPESYKPVAQPVDDFHRNNKLAAIFELKVGKGKLLVCGFDVSNAENPVAVQLKKSILDYIHSKNFHPDYEIPVSKLKEMFDCAEQSEK
jgi:hypothetical protein